MSSSPESTILLVNPSSLPARIEEALVTRKFFVETTDAGTLSGTLLVSTPDLIIASQENLDEACRGVRGAQTDKPLPLLLIAPRGSLSNFRLKTPKEVAAVVPFDMPITAIAVRVQTLLKRVASEHAMAASKPSGVSGEKASASAASTLRVSQVGAPHGARPRAQMKTLIGASATREQRLPIASKSPPPLGPASRRSAAAFAKTLMGSPKFGETPTEATEPAKVEPEQPYVPAALRRPEKPAVPAHAASAQDARDAAVSAQPETPRAVVPESDPTAGKRVSLEMPATALPGLRMALLDEDVTRADAVSSALRDAGHKVFLVSNTSGVTRWALLRRFAPQVVLVDEQSLARDGGQWLRQFRADPFLKSTSLVATPLEAIFDERTGKTNISGLTPQLEGISRIEMAFIAQLSPRREVQASAQQLNPARLLSILDDMKKSAHLECTTGDETLDLTVHDRKMSHGLLKKGESTHGRGIQQEEHLSPARALDFLLSRPDVTIVVHEKTDLAVRGGEDVSALLEAACAENLPEPAVHSAALSIPPSMSGARSESLRPLGRARVAQFLDEEDLPPDSDLPTRPIALDQIPILQERMRASAPMQMPAANPEQVAQSPTRLPSVAPPSAGLAAEGLVSTGLATAGLATAGLAADELVHSDEHARTTPAGFERFIPLEVAATVRAKRGLVVGASVAVAVLALGGLGVALVGGEDEARAQASEHSDTGKADEAVDAGTPEPENGRAPKAPYASDKNDGSRRPADDKASVDGDTTSSGSANEESDGAALYRVDPRSGAESCEKLLTQPLSYYQSRPRWEGQAIWKRARKQLLVGERDVAHQLMCQAAFIDPSGPASVGLASFYLTQRSLKNAHEWALYGIEQRPEFPRKSQELLGDTLSQMGKVDEARAVWLETMKLNRDDQTKLQAVARTLTSSAEQARRGGDNALAERLLRRATLFDEGNARAAGELAVTLLKNDEPGLARKWAQRALSLDANSSASLFVLGELALVAGNVSEAKRNFSQVPEGSTYSKEALARLDSL